MYKFLLLLITALLFSCTPKKSQTPPVDWETVQDTTDMVFTITGLDGPEAVRYDPEQDVYFISNFTGGGTTQDSTGFITKADAEGNILDLKFMAGTSEYPLHAPRGMFIVENTLWAADVLGVHGFDKSTGEQTDFIDFSEFETGFLNDVSANAQGTLFVTDTGTNRVFKVEGSSPSIYLDSLPEAPNGITLNPDNRQFVLAPWGGDQIFRYFSSSDDLGEYATLEGGYFDGIEFLHSNLLAASQQDSSIRYFDGTKSTILIKTTGRPADIGINTNLNHIAVPYIALDRVDIWNLSKQ
ncbi:SMP-30/gluconolactonase/LRE family protein [Gracilimonas sp.]|uniref:SMP-30/gluconolactonase/LRE family protein n=1 Tax=Gracilimonas sp. TaxID=1974203 RepID=UPI003BABBF1D